MASECPEQNDSPLVSIVMPIRNEADFIARSIRGILDNDYPADRMEIIVVDGMSDDGTRRIIEELHAGDSRIKLVDNPHRVVPHAMNAGIRESSGDIMIRIDGHAIVADDFVSQSVKTLREHPEAWCVAGPVETVSTTFVGKTIASAMSSPVGTGNAMFRLGNYEGYVDTAAFGAYWRWVFDKIGMFDEELVRNQDDELNLRVILAGGKIYMTPRIRSRYYARASLGKLARQYFQYGFWRARTIQKHRQPATLRQVVPLIFVATWLILIAGALLFAPLRWALAGFAVLYALGLVIGAVDVLRRTGFATGLLSPLVFAILHFAYGLGCLKGLVWFVLLRRGPASRPEDHPLSR
ncbi:MAG: glycosyltransferase family 2 protein [Phycisphaerae bacterium]|nr:glycosyltransferase family 2 protein [Phycisphaerae bacterium]